MSSGVTIRSVSNLVEAFSDWQELFPGHFETDHDYFVKMILAEGDDETGCVCLYDNHFIQKDGKRTLAFGNMHLPENENIAKALLQACVDYAGSEHYQYLLGPINGNTWNSYRLPIDHFGVQFLTDLPQPAYYQEYLQQAGFTITEEYSSSHSEIFHKEIDQKLLKQLDDQKLTIRNIRMDIYEQELKKIFHFCQEVFSNNVYFSPVSQEAFVSKYLSVRPFIDPDFVTLAENEDGVLKAIYFVLPDHVTPNRLVIKTIARAPGEEIKGIMMVMSQQVYNKAYEKGYKNIVHAFMHSSNRSVNLSRRFEGKRFKSYALFVKDLNG